MKFLETVFVLLMTLPALAQKPEALQLTMTKLLQVGIERNPDIRRADAGRDEREAQKGQLRGALFPTIVAKATADTHQNPTTVNSTSTPSTVTQVGELYSANLELTQPLYAGGALTGAIGKVKVEQDLADQTYFSTKQQVVKDMITAFYDLAQQQKLLAAAESNLSLLKTYLDITTRYEKIGRSRNMDRIQANVNYEMAQADVQSTQESFLKAQATLKKFLGEDYKNTPLQAQFEFKNVSVDDLSVNDALHAAKDNNPDVKSAHLKIEEVDYDKSIDLASDMPSLNLVASTGYQASDRKNLFEDSSRVYKVGLNLTIPIFSGLSSFSKRRVYAAKTYEAEHDRQKTLDELAQNIVTGIDSLKSAHAQVQLGESAAVSARKALEIANQGYKSGTVSSQDVLNMQRTTYDADKLYISSQFKFLKALLGMRQSMGIDLEKAYR